MDNATQTRKNEVSSSREIRKTLYEDIAKKTRQVVSRHGLSTLYFQPFIDQEPNFSSGFRLFRLFEVCNMEDTSCRKPQSKL